MFFLSDDCLNGFSNWCESIGCFCFYDTKIVRGKKRFIIECDEYSSMAHVLFVLAENNVDLDRFLIDRARSILVVNLSSGFDISGACNFECGHSLINSLCVIGFDLSFLVPQKF